MARFYKNSQDTHGMQAESNIFKFIYINTHQTYALHETCVCGFIYVWKAQRTSMFGMFVREEGIMCLAYCVMLLLFVYIS